MKKNFLGFLFSFLLCFGFYGLASAEITPSLSSPQVSGTNVTFNCSDPTNKVVLFYDSLGSKTARINCGDSHTSVTGNTYTAVECYLSNSGTSCDDPNSYDPENIPPPVTLTAMRLDTGYISDISYAWGSPTPPTTTGYEGGIFYPRDPVTGASDASLLIASVGSSTQDTFGSLGGVLAVVMGIILAFIVIKWIISLVKSTNDNKNNRTRV